MHADVCAYVCVYTCPCAHTLRPGEGCLILSFCTVLFFNSVSLSLKLTVSVRLMARELLGSAGSPSYSTGVIGMHYMYGFYVGAKDLNSGLHAHTASALTH